MKHNFMNNLKSQNIIECIYRQQEAEEKELLRACGENHVDIMAALFGG
jgi:hypothetical protein